MTSVAVTDHGNMFGTIDFYKKAKDAGIKPIIGMEAYVAGPKGREDRTEKVANHLILVAKNEEGYANLRYLSSMAYLEGFYYHPRIDKQVLKEHSKGLFALTACLGGEVTSACFRGDMDHARTRGARVQGHLRARALLPRGPVQRDARAGEGQREPQAALAATWTSRSCATADAHYIKREDARAHELLMCIASGKTLADGKRMKHSTDKLYVTSPAGDAGVLQGHARGRPQHQRIAEQCNAGAQAGQAHAAHLQGARQPHPGQLHGGAGSAPTGALQGAASRELATTRSTARPTRPAWSWSSASSRRWGSAATSSSSRTSSTGPSSTASRWARAVARAPARSSPTRCASPTWTRSRTTCSSSASSTPSACRCRTSTSTSARTAATRSSSTSAASTARTTSGRSSPSARSRPRACCATCAACSALPVQRGRPHRQAGARGAQHHPQGRHRAWSRASRR